MALRATITVVRASADPTYISLSAVTANVNAEAIAFTNPDSKNKWFTETTTLSDIQFSIVEKSVSEDVSVDDIANWAFAKNAPETLALVETFVKAVSYNRTVTDGFTLDDWAAVNLDFLGNKGNITVLEDIIGLDHGKVISDGYTLSEVITVGLGFIRDFTEDLAVDDITSLDYDKPEIDSYNISDERSTLISSAKTEILNTDDVNDINLGKAETDSFSLSEIYASSLSKFIIDGFTLDDSALVDKDYYGNKGNILGLTEIMSQGIGKNFTEIQNLSDETSASVNKPFTETLEFTETLASNIVKTVIDAFTLDDSTFIDKDYFGNKGNLLALTEIVQQGISKIESDIITIGELAQIGYSKPEIETISVDDVSLLHPNLIRSEIIGFDDSYVRSIMKVVSDAFVLDDTTKVNKNVDSNKGNIFSFSDVFSRTLSYVREYEDDFTFTEDFVRALTYVREYTDNYSVDDVRDVHLTKNLDDSFTVYDQDFNPLNINTLNSSVLNATDTSFLLTRVLSPNESLAFGEVTSFTHSKGVTDSAPIDDINALNIEKPETDSVSINDVSNVETGVNPSDQFSFSDSYTRVLNKAIEDGFTLDDSTFIDKDYSGNKGNIFGFTEVMSKVLSYKRTFTENLGFNDVANTTTEKGITDLAPLDDLTSLSSSKELTDIYNVDDAVGLGTDKPETDNFNISDTSFISSNPSPTDNLSFNDSYTRVLSKSVTDGFTLDDSTFIDKDYSGNKGNILSLSEVVARTLSYKRTFTENLAFSEYFGATVSKSITDLTNVDDVISLSQSKVIDESLTFSDGYGLQLEKTLSDGFVLDDFALVDKDYFGNKGNIVGLSDVVVVNLVQSNVLGGKALNTMSLN